MVRIHSPRPIQMALRQQRGSTPTTGAHPDPKLISKNITPSREVCNFGNCGSRVTSLPADRRRSTKRALLLGRGGCTMGQS